MGGLKYMEQEVTSSTYAAESIYQMIELKSWCLCNVYANSAIMSSIQKKKVMFCISLLWEDDDYNE